jgi:hypothetical protein
LGLARRPVTIREGLAIPGTEPGHGVEFDLDHHAVLEVPAADYTFGAARSRK